MWFETHVTHSVQPFTPQKLTEAFRMLGKDSGSQDLTTHYDIENAYAYYRHDTTLFSYVTM